MLKPNETRVYDSSGADADPLEGVPRSNEGFGSGEVEPSLADETLGDSERMTREMFLGSEQPALARGRRDYRTGTITAAVIGLSLLLGWMVGRAGWNMAVNRTESHSTETPEEALAATQMAKYSLPTSPGAEEPANLVEPAYATVVTPPTSSPAAKSLAPKSATAKSEVESLQPDGALVMYERGKVVFRATPSETTSSSAKYSGAVQAEFTKASDTAAAPDQSLSPAANGYVLTRVLPQYPEEARQQRVQGPVVLNAWVGTDGSVREVKVISGDPQLVHAAADAVRQWRFQPHHFRGKPTDFETRITVNFSLP